MDFLPQNLRYLRKKSGLTQEELAKHLGLERATYASYEQKVLPSVDRLVDISNHYSVTLDELVKSNLTLLDSGEELQTGMVAESEVQYMNLRKENEFLKEKVSLLQEMVDTLKAK